ncbi:hypothetical protein D9M68_956280 [compost metagenome]
MERGLPADAVRGDYHVSSLEISLAGTKRKSHASAVPVEIRALALFRLHAGGHMLARDRHHLAARGNQHHCRQPLDRSAVAGHQGERP